MKNSFSGLSLALFVMAGMCALTASPAHAEQVAVLSPASGGVQVDILGVNNALVRVKGDGRYLLMPVEESTDDATVNLLVDNKLEKTFYVRLARQKVDYMVPFDLTPYNGHDVVLNIVTNQNRSSVRDAMDDCCWQNFSLSDTFDTVNREQYRPKYHHTPLYGWMNDPNGMFYKDGLWHLYYQWNPYGSKWQNMTWGHSSSPDLLHWTHHEPAITPNGLGAVFSGSCAIDRKGTAGFGQDAVVAMYTSAAASQVQSLAHTADNGMHFNIYPGNPVITLDSEARDPNFFYDADSGLWTLALAHALDHEILFYTSPDMKNWTLRSAFGKGLGAQGGVWECPDLFKLPIDGEKGKSKWVLIVNLNPGGPFGGSAAQYFIGDFKDGVFTPDLDADGNVPLKWMDYGKDHYATVTWSDAPDGRRTAIGWMSNWQYAAEVPTRQYRSANTLPRELSLYRAKDKQIYLRTIPSPEIRTLRDNPIVSISSEALNDSGISYNLPAQNNGVCEIITDLSVRDGGNITMTLNNEKGEKAVIIYDSKSNTISFDRRESGVTEFSMEFPCVTTAPAMDKPGKVSLDIFIDSSSVEVFGNNGKSVMTNLLFPTQPYSTLTISSDAKAEVNNLQIYPLKPVM